MEKKTQMSIKLGLSFLIVMMVGFGPSIANDESDAIVFRTSELHQPDQICTLDLNDSTINCWSDDSWAVVFNPLWSPDGRYIAFTATREGYGEVYVMGADGSNQMQLTSVRSPISYPIPEWLPDSSWIHYVVDDENYVPTGYVVAVDGTEECILFDSAIQEGIVQSDCPYQLDTKLIALYRNDNLDIYRIDFKQAVLHQLTESDGQVLFGNPRLSPDGRHIAFWGIKQQDNSASYTEDTFELYVMNADGSNLRYLMDTRLRYSSLGWSPDSTKIAFSAAEGETHADIYTIDIRNSNVKKLTEGLAKDIFGDWSPDGQHIVFSRLVEPFSIWQLYIIDADGTNLRYLADCGNKDCSPDWK